MHPLDPRRLFIVAVATAAVGCAPRPVIDYAGEARDGLVPVRDSGMQEAWIRPDVNLSRYRKVMLAPVEVQFRTLPPGAGKSLNPSGDREFPISPDDQARLVTVVTEVFREELGESRTLALTDQPGPEVLIIRAQLLDIISRVPPEKPSTQTFVDEIGEATLVLELSDAESGATLVRATDRRAADGGHGGSVEDELVRGNSVVAWSEVRRATRRWAAAVTRRIDQLHTRGRMPGTTPTG
jgi:hypothetical protein